MPPVPLEFELPAELRGSAAVRLLASHLDLWAGRPRTERRVLLDTFDGRLRAAGLSAAHSAGRAATAELSVQEPGMPVRAVVAPRARRWLAEELPPGPVRDRLTPVLAGRALLPVVTVRSRVRPLAVLNRDAKTVVRMAIEEAEVVLDRGASVTIGPRLHVRPVLGYDAALSGVAGVLSGRLGLPAAPASLFDLAVAAAGGRPEGVSSKVAVGLAPGTLADEAANRVLERLADVAAANVAGTLEDLDTEFLHDLRVAVRRARSVLREMAGVHPPAPRAQLRAQLRWMQQLTGPVRDLDVLLLGWDELTEALPPDRRSELVPLRDLLIARRAAAFRQLRRGLRGRRFGDALAAWRAFASAPRDEASGGSRERPRAALSIEAVAADRIRRTYRTIVRDGSAIDDRSPDAALHELRKRGKELRYLLELFGELFPGRVVKPMVKSLKDLQDVLGRFQDRAVQAELLRGLGGDIARTTGGPAALMALGLVVHELEADRRDARTAFAERFAAFASDDQRAVVRATFPRLTR